MIHELKPPVTQQAQRLFAPFTFHASCAAVLQGASPGTVLVDDASAPTGGFVSSPEGAYLSGEATNLPFWRDLEDYLHEPSNLGHLIWQLFLIASSKEWCNRLGTVRGANGIRSFSRRHYQCNTGDRLPTIQPPPGADLLPIDQEFLDSEKYARPEHMDRWIRNNWGSRAHFLDTGFGVVTVCANEVVAWSLADCIAGSACEIGIHTKEEWRRDGMGAFTAGGAIRRAAALVMKTVGRHCPEENVASWRTAERAGMALERRYEACMVCKQTD